MMQARPIHVALVMPDLDRGDVGLCPRHASPSGDDRPVSFLISREGDTVCCDAQLLEGLSSGVFALADESELVAAEAIAEDLPFYEQAHLRRVRVAHDERGASDRDALVRGLETLDRLGGEDRERVAELLRCLL